MLHLDERSRTLQTEWVSAAQLGDRASYVTMLGNEGFWRLLGYPGNNNTEAGAVQDLVEHLVAPEGSAVETSHKDLMALTQTARKAIEEMAHSFLHESPRLREEALDGVSKVLRDVLDALDNACDRAGSAYPACAG